MAKRLFWWRVVKYLRPEFIKSPDWGNPLFMVAHDCRMAVRKLLAAKIFSVVNIAGMALGIASALIIFLWTRDELRVDKFHSRVDRLYQVMENQKYSDGQIFTFNTTPGPLAPYVKDHYPEIETATRVTWQIKSLFGNERDNFYEDGRYVDSDFLKIFSFPLKSGDIHTALEQPNTVVISQSMAKSFFGEQDPIGQPIVLDHRETFIVSGVLEEIPRNSSLRFDYLLPFEPFYVKNKQWLDLWFNNSIRTYLLLKPHTDVESFEGKFRKEIGRHMDKTNVELFIQPFGESYLKGNFENGQQSGGRITYVYTFIFIAILVLFIACINYINLATAQAARKAHETGLRKVIGGQSSQLISQFITESLVTVLISALVAVTGVLLAMPLIRNLTGKQLELSLLSLDIWPAFCLGVILVALLAGIYPAVILSGYKPVDVLKGQLRSGQSGTFIRRALVVIQFTVSIILLVSTSVVFRQMNYMDHTDTGFDRDNLFYSWMQGEIPAKWEVVRRKLLESPGISDVTSSGQLPIGIESSDYDVHWKGKSPDDKILFNILEVDYEFVGCMKMAMAEGRAFDREVPNESAHYLINEQAAQAMNMSGHALGEELSLWGRKGTIVGVVRDFNYGSLHDPILPIILKLPQGENGVGFGTMIIRAKDNQMEQALRSANTIWNEFGAGYPFEYSFLSNEWHDLYRAEAQRGKIFNAMAILSILISCMGLFGLAAFSAERRTRELGVRKILGASVPGLIGLISLEFALLVAAASMIGCPLAWYLMEVWLSQYAYHVSVGWSTMVLAALTCLFISFATVAYHSLKASLANPIQCLRYE